GFFFASRRRHTRSKRDWSSDVCSSDLAMITNVVFFIVLSLSSAIPAAIRRHRTFTIAYYQGKGNFLSQRRAVGICLFLEYLAQRSEEHTSELQSRFDLVCRLLLEKQKA